MAALLSLTSSPRWPVFQLHPLVVPHELQT